MFPPVRPGATIIFVALEAFPAYDSLYVARIVPLRTLYAAESVGDIGAGSSALLPYASDSVRVPALEVRPFCEAETDMFLPNEMKSKLYFAASGSKRCVKCVVSSDTELLENKELMQIINAN